jgi:hypothetical protein
VTERLEDRADSQSNILNEDLSGLSDNRLGEVLDNVIATYGCEAVPDLEKLAISSDSRVATAACCALGATHDVSAANALLRIRESTKDKNVRKEAGHALHKLRSVGIEPGERSEPAGEMPGLARTGKMENAYASYYDPLGMRLLIMGIRPPGRPLFRVIWAISQEKGIHDSYVTRLNKRGFEEWIDEFRLEKEGISQIDPAHCRYLANEAYEKTSQSGASLPDGIGIYLEAVKNMPDPPERPIIYEFLEEAREKSDSTVVLMSESLLDLVECTWRLGGEKVGEYAERVVEVLSSVIVTSDIVREERLQKIVDDYIAAEFSSEIRNAYRRRLEETAYLFVLDSKMDYARSAFSVALLMGSGGDLRTIPFIRGLVGRSIGVIRADSREGKEFERRMAEKERSQLVKPITQDRSREEMLREIRRG